MMRRLEAMVGRVVVQTVLTIVVVTLVLIFVAGLVGAIGVIHGWTCGRHAEVAPAIAPPAASATQPTVTKIIVMPAPPVVPKAAPARPQSPCPPAAASPCQSLWDSAQDAQAAYLVRHQADAGGEELLTPEDYAAIQNLSRPPQ